MTKDKKSDDRETPEVVGKNFLATQWDHPDGSRREVHVYTLSHDSYGILFKIDEKVTEQISLTHEGMDALITTLFNLPKLIERNKGEDELNAVKG